jgi:tetratricopeptide (TPR) repeat protein
VAVSGKRLVVVGWTAADWPDIHPAIERGALPQLEALIESGVSGPFPSLAPHAPPIVATSIATGRHPAGHGVLAELERRPDGGGVQPIGRRSWRAPAFWELLVAAGLRTAVVNWPATAPADRWPGIVVDETFAIPLGCSFDDWPLPPHCVSPAWRAVMADLRVHPGEIGADALRQLVPRLAEIDPRRDNTLARLAGALARSASVHAAATHLAEAAEWDMLAVDYPLFADVRTAVSRVPSDRAALYGNAGAAAYQLLDIMLGRLRDLAGKDAAMVVIGAGGGRLSESLATQAADPEGAAARDRGVLVAAGPGIAVDAMLHQTSSVDLAPSILAYFGLSAPSDGQVLEALFSDPPQTTPIGLPVGRPAATPTDPAAHLLAIGYADRVSQAQAFAMAATEIAGMRNLADSHLARGEWQPARAALEQLLTRMPGDYLAHLKLGRILLTAGDIEGARPHAAAAIGARPNLPWGDLLMGSLLVASDAASEAEAHLRRARELGANTPAVVLRLGWVSVMLRHWQDAEQSFRAVLETDAMIAEAHAGLGLALQGQGQGEAAEVALRRSIALAYDNPLAHLHLSQVLAARGAHAAAADAARMALAQRPGFGEAQELLARIERALASGLVAQAMLDRDVGPAR